MKHTVLLLIIIFGVGQVQAQTNTSLMHLRNTTNTQMNNINNPFDGSVLFGNSDTSLFQWGDNTWMQLRQTLKVCKDQLSILNGNSVSFDALNSQFGRTIVWQGNKWESNDFLNLDTLAGVTDYENITNISSLTENAVIVLSANQELILEGRYLYVLSLGAGTSIAGSGGSGSGGLEIIDISTGTMTHKGSIIASFSVYNNFGTVKSFCKKGNYLYVATGKGPSVVDISDPSNPNVVNSYYEFYYINGMVRNYDNYIYYGCDNKIIIYEITGNGDALSKITTIDNSGVNPIDMIVDGNKLFLIGSNKIVAADLTNPTSPVLYEKTNSTNFPIQTLSNHSAVIKNNRLYIANTGTGTSTNKLITSINITDISNMTVSSFITYDQVAGITHKEFYHLTIDGNLLVAHGTVGGNDNYVGIFDISNANSISFLNNYNAPNPKNKVVVMRNDTFFVARSFYRAYNYKIDRNEYEPNVNIGTPTGIYALSVNGNASKQGGGNWLGYSDRRVKKSINPYTKGLEVIRNITPYQFNYRTNSGYTDTSTTFTGVMAQEMQHILPESVRAINDTKGASGLKDKLQFDSSPILWNLVNAVQELKNEQDLIEQKINSKSNEK